MPSLNQPLIRGDYERINFTITEPDPLNPGSRRNRNVSTDTFRFTAKRDPSKTEVVIGKTSESGGGIVKTDAANGQGYIEILPANTSGLLKDVTLACDLEGSTADTPPKPYTTLFAIKVIPDIST